LTNLKNSFKIMEQFCELLYLISDGKIELRTVEKEKLRK